MSEWTCVSALLLFFLVCGGSVLVVVCLEVSTPTRRSRAPETSPRRHCGIRLSRCWLVECSVLLLLHHCCQCGSVSSLSVGFLVELSCVGACAEVQVVLTKTGAVVFVLPSTWLLHHFEVGLEGTISNCMTLLRMSMSAHVDTDRYFETVDLFVIPSHGFSSCFFRGLVCVNTSFFVPFSAVFY